MESKRARSGSDLREQLQTLKKRKRAESDSPVASVDVPSHPDPASASCQNRGSEDGNVRNDCKTASLGHDPGLAAVSEILPQEGVESCLPELLSTPIASWIRNLPEDYTEFDRMAQAQFKKPRSTSDLGLGSCDNDSSNEARRTETNLYKDPRYPALIRSKGVHLNNSKAGPLPEEIKYCEGLLFGEGAGTDETELTDSVLDSDFLENYVNLMKQSSKLRLCIDLHSRLVPSAEIPSLLQGKEGDLQEGCNDRWLQAIEFLPKLPQPHRTVAFRAEVFTDLERQKLGYQPLLRSLYAACEGMLFPFFTCEVKAALEGLETGRRANANSMGVALRGVVDLFRRANMEHDIHRKILGIVIVHDASRVEIYGHFPEIDGPKTAFYQKRIREFDYAADGGKNRYTSCRFVRGVYTKFAPRHLARLKKAIAKLEMPSQPNKPASFTKPTASNAEAMSVTSAALSSRGGSTLEAEVAALTVQIAKLTQNLTNLQNQLERERQEAKKELERERQEAKQELERERQEAKQELERARQEAKRREAALMKLISDRLSAT